jgi:hypothetical protein
VVGQLVVRKFRAWADVFSHRRDNVLATAVLPLSAPG